MNKKLKITLGVVASIIVLGVGGYMAYWGYISYKYGQHLPSIEINVKGVEHKYNRFVPTNPPEGPMSLVIMLNGGGVGAWPFPQQRDWEALGEETGIILAVPVGKQIPPNEGAWQLNTDDDSYHDIDFMNGIIDDIVAQYPIDEARIYAVGYSLGSMFSYELACQMSDRFAAIASFAGTMPVSPKDCNPERNVPLMHIHGIEDPIIAYANTWDWKSWDSVGTMRDIPSLVEFWRERYNCQSENLSESGPESHFVYEDCDQESRVEHYRLADRGHGWPPTLGGIDTYRVLWSFLSSYQLP